MVFMKRDLEIKSKEVGGGERVTREDLTRID